MRPDFCNAPFVKKPLKDRSQGSLATKHNLGEGKGEASWQGGFQPRSCDQSLTRTALRKGKLFSSPEGFPNQRWRAQHPQVARSLGWSWRPPPHEGTTANAATNSGTRNKSPDLHNWPSPPSTSLTARRSSRRGTQSSDEEAGACSEHNGRTSLPLVRLSNVLATLFLFPNKSFTLAARFFCKQLRSPLS